jgi:hypothetical protein
MRRGASRTFPVGAFVAVLVVLAWFALRAVAPTPPAGDAERPGAERDRSPAAPPPSAETEEPATVRDPDDEVLLHGVVVAAESGQPIANATVEVWRGDRRVYTRTGTDGRWSLVAPRPGWRLDRPYRPSGYVASAVGRLRRKGRLLVPAHVGEWRLAPIRLRRVEGHVAGRVVDASGEGIPGARIWLGRPPPNRRPVPWNPGAVVARTDGSFGPVPAAAGFWEVHAGKFGWIPGSRRVRVPPDAPPVTIELVLGPMELADGTVVDDRGEPVAGAGLSARLRELILARTDGEGRFRWPLEEGQGHVYVRREGHLDLPESHELTAEGPNRIVLPRGRRLTGRILDADDAPAVDVVVEAAFNWRYEVMARTDAEGRFALEPCSLGKLEILVRSHGLSRGRFEVEAGEARDLGDLRLPPAAAVRLRVIDAATERPLHGARVVGPNSRHGAATDAEGRVSLPVREDAKPWGDLDIRFPGYGWRRMPVPAGGPDEHLVALHPLSRVVLRVVDASGRPIPDAGAIWKGAFYQQGAARTDDRGQAVLFLPLEAPCSVRAGHPTVGSGSRSVSATSADGVVEIVLGERGTDRPDLVTVVVVDGDGKPVTGAEGHVRGTGWTARSGEDGVLRLHAKQYDEITFSAPGREVRRTKLPDLREGRLQLREDAAIRGRVVDAAGRPVPGTHVRAVGSRASTDGRGEFILHGLAAGTAARVRLHDGRLDARWAVAGGEALELVHPGFARLRVSPPDGFDTSSPEGSASVRLLDRRDDAGVAREWEPVPRLDGGAYVLTVPAGRIRWRLRPTDTSPFWTGDLSLAPGETRTVRIRAGPRLTLRGDVRGSDGEPIAGLFLRDALTGEEIGLTEEEGRIRLLSTAPESARVLVLQRDHAPVVTEELDLVRGATLDVRLRAGGAVRVRVRPGGNLPRGTKARFLADVGPHGPWTGTGNLYRVPPGRQRIEVRFPERLPVIRHVQVVEGRTADLEVPAPE